MPTKKDRAERYQAQAADMLKFAARSKNATIKAEYERLAAEYNQLAREMEQAGTAKR